LTSFGAVRTLRGKSPRGAGGVSPNLRGQGLPIQFQSPQELQPGDLAAIEALVAAEAGDAAVAELRGSLRKIKLLVLLREGAALHGVAALRRSGAGRSGDIARRSGFPGAADYRLEIGHFCIARSLRRRGLGRRLAEAILEWVDAPVFATTRPEEVAAARLLTGLGFRAVGRPWADASDAAESRLWTRAAGEDGPPAAAPPGTATVRGTAVAEAEGAEEPRVLLLAARRHCWPVLRLSAPLAASGFRVAVATPANSLASLARAPEWLVSCAEEKGSGITRDLRKAVAALRPTCLLPTDNRSSLFLGHLLSRGAARRAPLADILARSLGRADSFGDRLLKHRTLAVARSLGVAAPPGGAAADLEEVRAIAADIGFPLVLKRPVGSGGSGVLVCRDAAALPAAFAALADRQWHGGRRRHNSLPPWFPPFLPIEVQRFVVGRPAMSCAVARDGRLLAALCAVSERTGGPVSPSSVVRLLHHEAMVRATAAMAAAFGASGFVSFDFILEEDSGKAWLIECNPRPIGIAHLGPRVGVDLMRAYRQSIEKSVPAEALSEAPAFARGEATAARFPAEWTRDPASPFLAGAFHDVPLHEPDALSAFLAAAGRSLPPAFPEGRQQRHEVLPPVGA